jgi:hypothetical protein
VRTGISFVFRDHLITEAQKQLTEVIISVMAIVGLSCILGSPALTSDPISLSVLVLVGVGLLGNALWRAWMVYKAVRGTGTWQEAIIECVHF